MSDPGSDDDRSVLKSLLVDRLAMGAHRAIRHYAQRRHAPPVPPWEDLDDHGRNVLRAAVVAMLTTYRSSLDELRELMP
jgi:hypothetical protein